MGNVCIVDCSLCGKSFDRIKRSRCSSLTRPLITPEFLWSTCMGNNPRVRRDFNKNRGSESSANRSRRTRFFPTCFELVMIPGNGEKVRDIDGVDV